MFKLLKSVGVAVLGVLWCKDFNLQMEIYT